MDFAEGGEGEEAREGRGGERRGGKQSRRHSTGAPSFVLPHPGETQATAIVAVPRLSFNAPYLIGTSIHFEKKLKRRRETLSQATARARRS